MKRKRATVPVAVEDVDWSKVADFLCGVRVLMTRHRDSLVRETEFAATFEQLAAMALAEGLRERLATGELRMD